MQAQVPGPCPNAGDPGLVTDDSLRKSTSSGSVPAPVTLLFCAPVVPVGYERAADDDMAYCPTSRPPERFQDNLERTQAPGSEKSQVRCLHTWVVYRLMAYECMYFAGCRSPKHDLQGANEQDR